MKRRQALKSLVLFQLGCTEQARNKRKSLCRNFPACEEGTMALALCPIIQKKSWELNGLDQKGRSKLNFKLLRPLSLPPVLRTQQKETLCLPASAVPAST